MILRIPIPDTIRVILKRDVLSVLTKKFKTRKGRRNLSEGRLHSFRHFFYSQCAAQGVPEQTVINWLGHRDSETLLPSA
jgi:integrase